MTNGKTIALTRQSFVDKVMSLLFNMLSRLVIIFLLRSKRLNFMTAIIALCKYCIFYNLKFCSNPALSKSIDLIFPTTLAHLVSLCHILVILAIF